MRRWFPVLAASAMVLWASLMVSLLSDGPSSFGVTRFDRAALASLAVHMVGIVWLWAVQPRFAAARLPGWVQVQAAKHRRKGVTFAAWCLVILGLGWIMTRLDSQSSSGAAGRAFSFGAALNLGFQPGMFVAEWLVIVAQSKLSRFASAQMSPELAESFEPS